MKIGIIGGGPAGMIAGIIASQNNNEVILFEKNEKLGKKLYITGKGRCNVTNNSDNSNIFNNIVNNQKFLYSGLNIFNSSDVINFFESNGVKLKTERGNRVFPESDKASDITFCLEKLLKKNNVKILLNSEVSDVYKNEDNFYILSNNEKYEFDKIIITTGGVSYKLTGSTGDGYKFARKFGHTIIEPKPALSAINLNNKFNLAGLSLKNVKLCAKDKKSNFNKEFFGELLFTHNGISGPIALSMSSYINRLENVELYLDLKPALNIEQVRLRVEKEIKTSINKEVKNVLKTLMPYSLAIEFAKMLELDINKKCNVLTKEEKNKIINGLKYFKLNYDKLEDINLAIVTSGGVNIKEINPKTMESKICNGLFFAGEVLDLDALTGGYNMQIALTTGYIAGISINM